MNSAMALKRLFATSAIAAFCATAICLLIVMIMGWQPSSLAVALVITYAWLFIGITLAVAFLSRKRVRAVFAYIYAIAGWVFLSLNLSQIDARWMWESLPTEILAAYFSLMIGVISGAVIWLGILRQGDNVTKALTGSA